MKVSTFFKILNRKIAKYDKIATNPFTNPQPIVLVWVEDEKYGYRRAPFGTTVTPPSDT